ncbi:MAG: hypothetical protein JSS24_00835 [Proteobacteria bacterium]|nr:hypothetical protein [Pseudomonadota bacterium]
MSTSRPTTVGRTRTCPHCRATILESASVCPGCNHHLRFGKLAADSQRLAKTALKVEGTVRHAPGGEPCEYSVVIEVRNERGEQVARQVVGVGALQPQEQRTFTLSVDLLLKPQ